MSPTKKQDSAFGGVRIGQWLLDKEDGVWEDSLVPEFNLLLVVSSWWMSRGPDNAVTSLHTTQLISINRITQRGEYLPTPKPVSNKIHKQGLFDVASLSPLPIVSAKGPPAVHWQTFSPQVTTSAWTEQTGGKDPDRRSEIDFRSPPAPFQALPARVSIDLSSHYLWSSDSGTKTGLLTALVKTRRCRPVVSFKEWPRRTPQDAGHQCRVGVWAVFSCDFE